MEGFEQDTVHYSNQSAGVRSGAGSQSSGARSGQFALADGLSASAARFRFRQFILGFTNERFRFKYREALQHSVNAGERRLEVDLRDLQNFDEPLAVALRKRPDDALPVFEKAALEVAARLANVSGAETLHRTDAEPLERAAFDALLAEIGSIQLVIRSDETPMQIRDLLSPHISKLVRISGIIISASAVSCRARMIKIQCKDCRSRKTLKAPAGFGGVQLPRVCDGGVQDGGAQCQLDPFVVLPDESEYVDQQRLKMQELPENVPTGELPRSVMLSVNRALVDQASPGMRVSVVAIYSVFQSRAAQGRGGAAEAVRNPYLQVVGMTVEGDSQHGGRSNMNVFSLEEEEQMLRIARMPDLYQKLCASIAPEIFGHDGVKAAIACQLFGGSPKHLPDGMRLRGDINVLLLGDPSAGKSQMLKFAEKAAPVSVYTSGKGSSAAGLTAALVRDAGSGGEFHLEGGAMVLADGGLVCIDEFDKMRVADRVAIHEAMEQQTISIAKAGITAVLNSRTSVLAAANPAFGRYDDLKSASENIEFQSTILSRFDMIFIVRDVRSDAQDTIIARHVLGLHMRGNNARSANGAGNMVSRNKSAVNGGLQEDGEAYLDLDTLKRYVAYCRARCSPRLTKEAAEVLRNNYVSIRQSVRRVEGEEDSTPVIPITVRQLEAIVRISESLAKMTLSSTATEVHVTEAIRLFRAATMDSAHTGTNHVMETSLRPEFYSEVQAVERAVKQLLPLGSLASEKKLNDDLMATGHSRSAVRWALNAMIRRQELDYKEQRRKIIRLK
ncbi:DNA replication licensing factor MCM5 [Porphyridium purpureum]|uniref:DNA replication licensing factor MCM5 n=1 Tax=Porphyridium purpureum TaxID=35688 RepID=A0A5J4YUD8_PORPP|nr:DNA replication licensing factor MCM5 [Porphyridium purpureum]|eukprot:POR6685..scf227_4